MAYLETRDLLCSLGCPQTQDPSASAIWLLALQVCVTKPGFKAKFCIPFFLLACTQAHESIYGYYITRSWARAWCSHMQNSALGVECDRSKFRQDCAPNRGGTCGEVCAADKQPVSGLCSCTFIFLKRKRTAAVLLVICEFAHLIIQQAVMNTLNMNTVPTYVEGLSFPARHHWCN